MNNTQKTYLLTDGRLYKIGRSKDPVTRVKQLQTANPHIEMICYGEGVTEKYLHELYFRDRVVLEWFELNETKLDKVKQLISIGEKGRKRVGKNSGKRHTLSDAEKKRNTDGVARSLELNKSYIMPFGKYKGTKLINMTSDEQLDYCRWLYEERCSKASKTEKRTSRIIKALGWHLRNQKSDQ